MRITMKALAAGPDGTLHPGRTYEVPRQVTRDRARQLLDGGYAVRADQDPATRPPAPDPEPPAAKPLERHSVDELKAHAAARGIDLGDATKKADLLAAIAAADGNGAGG